MDRNFYDFVLIDCSPSFSTLTLNALSAANLLIIPLQCEYYAVQSLRWIMKLARLAQKKTNPGLRYQVLMTMYDQRNRICRLIRTQMQEALGQLLFETVIEIDTKLRESPVYHQPVNLYAPNTRGAQQYRALARELVNHGDLTESDI